MQSITKQEMAVLVKIQKSETEIVRIGSLLEKIEQEKAALEQELTAFEDGLTRQKQAFEVVTTRCREAEEEIQLLDERIAGSRKKLRHVRTNKEYQSLQREIDDNGKKKEAIETDYFEQLEAKETAEALVKEKSAAFDQLEQKIRSDQAEIETKGADDRQLLVEYREQRDQIGKSLDPVLYEKFLEISRSSEGTAVVPVKKEVCRGCFMNIPPQLYIEVQRANSLILCPQCNRILYYAEE
ncbi:MAG TPA: C4-type zinc ribbon domain-containing protein [Desulfobacteraceae bacterium]|nr:C4-type zinc ribbon domain-containing protein [Desulfobacteraceae bacterium]